MLNLPSVEGPASYKTIQSAAEGQFSASGSKFLAFAYPIIAEAEVRSYRELLKSQHHKAVHVVWAMRLGHNGEEERSSDDGEPSGSAGKPVLNAIRSLDLTHTAILVVRYFGGKKLGIPGLIAAYKAAAVDCLQHADIITVEIFDTYIVRCSNEHMQTVLHQLNKSGARVINTEWGESCTFTIAIQRAWHAKINQTFTALWQAEVEYTGTL